MFDTPVAEAAASYLSNEEALVKLTGDGTLDVVAVVAGQPAKLLAEMKPEARRLVKLLRFDASRPESQAALKIYFPATVRAASYPNLLAEDVPGIAVKTYLVTYDYDREDTVAVFRKFARSLCQNLATLQSAGHPKWHEVDLALPALGRGWVYYPPTSRELANCASAASPRSSGPVRAGAPTKACNQQERVLGLCR
jgi:uncharacterized protein